VATGLFGTAINCIDGRVQIPLYYWMKERYNLDYVDMINEPGPDGILSGKNEQVIQRIKEKVLISVSGHHSKVLVIAGHYDCAGNPVTEEEHKRQIKEAVDKVKKWNIPELNIEGVWINQKWSIEVIA